MSKAIEKHLENITVDALMEFRGDSFMSFASIYADNVNTSIGVNGLGQFVVISNKTKFVYNNPQKAIEAYAEIVNF